MHLSVYASKIAFTLAEVLITLGIIGVVAALTLPTLIASHKEKARITALKKIYSQMQNAFNLAVYEYGQLSTWDLTKTDTGTKDADDKSILDYSGANKFMANITQYFNKSDVNTVNINKQFSLDGRETGENMSVDIANDERRYFVTNDGFILEMGWISSGNPYGYIGDFWVILPNEKTITLGVTKFHFNFSEKGFIPDGQTQQIFKDQCDVKNKSMSSDKNGRGCTAWALQKENMEYLRCNDLSWNGKDKCK